MLAAIFGALIVAVILWEAFETVVLPRRVARRFRLTRLVYRSTWFLWKAVARGFRKSKSRETFLSFYGPLSLPILFAVWAALIIVGFGLLYYSGSTEDSTHPTLETCIYLSGTTMFTLGLGDVIPHTWRERFLAVIESGLGFGFLALILSYLPVIYQAFSRREVNIVLLDARAGSPPTAAELLRRHSGSEGAEPLKRLLHDWEHSSADMLESHVSYPAVSYFRSQHTNESWLAALAAILDTCSLLLSYVENTSLRQARLTFAMCRHTVVDLAQLFGEAPPAHSSERLPPQDFERLRATLTEAGFVLRNDQAARDRLTQLRAMYEPYLQALSAYLYMEVPPWILATEITDNWRTSAWGRVSGLTMTGPGEPDDHAD
ncbi:MAG TPA: potassium channel family protein [Candidatus Acidoferrales bacterium]|nr:potassium channel family protein [Candidatus Acidoferrales bacterium]